LLALKPWASEGGQGRGVAPWILKLLAKKIVFLVLNGKKQISPFLTLPGNIFEKSPSAPSGKNPSEDHD